MSPQFLLACLVLAIELADGRNLTNRITGGQETDIRDFPYQVMLICRRDKFITICGGALIEQDAVLTAAHCVANCDVDHLSVTAGVSQFDFSRKHCVRKIVVHGDYEDDGVSSDIALIFLEKKLRLSDRIKTIAIADHQYPGGTEAYVSGWGHTEKRVTSSVLRYAKVKIISNKKCESYNSLVDSTQLCTAADKKGPCKGDSGGPLVANNELVGLVSYGKAQCDENFVRMYTNVVHFRDFIDDTLDANS